MKVFAICMVVLACLGVLIGLLMLTGGPTVQSGGMVLVGAGFMSILLSCAVIALADIRKCLLANNPRPEQPSSPSPLSIL
jgi:hypothetical protein